MTFKDIYNQTISYYPSEIVISDGKKIENGGGYFKRLSIAWNNAELKTKKESDFIQLMVWAIFCAYHKKAIENFMEGKKTVLLSELNLAYTKQKFEESLLDNAAYYSNEKEQYIMNKVPKIQVDFNASIDYDLVLLSKTDRIKDSNGNGILLKEGMHICVYQDDENDDGEQDELIAYGTAELNNSGARTTCKWNVRIDKNGIRHQSDREKTKNSNS